METIKTYLTDDEKAKLSVARTIGELVEIGLAMLERMPQPVRWVAGPLTSGKRTPQENRRRLNLTIFRSKEVGATTFNYLPFQRRAMQILHQELRGCILTRGEERKLQEQLRDELYVPFFESGKITELCIMPDSEESLNVHWMWGFASARHIPRKFIPEHLVPK